MSEYKVYYFEARALGEPIRFMLSYMGKEFEDIRIQFPDWPANKESMPFGKMPVLEIDGEKMHQSMAICRYLGKQVGLAGSSDLEALNIDMAVDTFQDFRVAFTKYHFEEDVEKKEKAKEKIINETVPYYMTKFDEQIKSNGGYLANGKLSWGDLYITAFSETLNDLLKEDLFQDNYPNFSALREKVLAIPQIKEWVEKRPKTSV